MGPSAKKKRDEFSASLDEKFDVKSQTDLSCSFSQVLNVVQHQTDGDRTSPLQVSVTTQIISRKPRFVTLSISDPSNVSSSYSRKFGKTEFNSYKSQEGLFVEFEHFPELLVELLEKCLSESQSSTPNFLKMDLTSSKSVLEFTELNKIKPNVSKQNFFYYFTMQYLGKTSKKKKTEKSDIVQKGRVGWTPKPYF